MRASRLLACILPLVCACEYSYERMVDQDRYDTYEPNPYLPRGATQQPAPEGTVSRDAVLAPALVATGRQASGAYADRIPVPVDRRFIQRGRTRFDIHCATCHGHTGDGQSEVAENMTEVKPPSFLDGPVRDYPPGRIFAVATEGYGLMPSYRDRISLPDRWAVVAYIQVLQLSQRAHLARLPAHVAKEARSWLK